MSEDTLPADDDKWLKFQLICKPEQSGKTFVMISHIIKDITEPMQGKEIINFILCDNNLLLTKQTSDRVDHDLKEYTLEGDRYVELSSHSRTDYHDTASVFQAILVNGARNIICCTNGKRMDDIYKLIQDMNTSPFTKGKFHFNVWLDEADKFMKFIDTTLRPIVDKYSNVNCKLITATPHALFQKYEYMNVLPLENTTSALYHGWCDYLRCKSEECSATDCEYADALHSHYTNNIKVFEKEGSYLDFVEHILTNVASDKINPRTKWFIPGLNTKKSHELIKCLCIGKGMAVLRVNGDGMVLTIPETLEQITYKKDDVFNSKLIDIYIKHKLERFAFVITGNICIARGITIMSDNFMIDYAILSHDSSKDEVSQLAGRMKGNIKGFKTYNEKKLPMIFTTEKFNKKAIEWENKSKKLAKIAFEKEQNGMITVIDKHEFKTCDKPFHYICSENLFNSFEEAKLFLFTKEREMDCKVKITKNSVIHEHEGYCVTSKLLQANKTVADLTKDDRITMEKARTIPPSRCISSTDKGSRYLILPVYENEMSPPKSVKYQVRYIKFD
jgi:hypothetical protein